jgi:DNA gyrase subunit B
LKRRWTYNRTGTVTFKPDLEIFKEEGMSNLISILFQHRFRETAFLNAGLHFAVSDERTQKKKISNISLGVAEFVSYMNQSKKAASQRCGLFQR